MLTCINMDHGQWPHLSFLSQSHPKIMSLCPTNKLQRLSTSSSSWTVCPPTELRSPHRNPKLPVNAISHCRGVILYSLFIWSKPVSLPYRFAVLASHTNGPTTVSRSTEPTANVTPWRTWNLQHVANYDFRDTHQRESSSNEPSEPMADQVTNDRRPPVETPKRVLIGTWNVKKKATHEWATIFDTTDRTQLQTIPSKFILEMVRYY